MRTLVLLLLTLLLAGCGVAVPLCVPPRVQDYEPVCRGVECVTTFDWGIS